MSDLVPFDRWGRIAAPAESAGAYLLVEVESGDGWKKPPPVDAVRLWHRTPGAADDDDFKNWTVWYPRDQLGERLAAYGYVIEEWLPKGVEPSWE